MYTPIFTPIFIHSSEEKKPKNPKCPHCKKTLKGWEKPSKDDLSGWIIGAAFGALLLIIANFAGMVIGGADASFSRCSPMFSKRYHFLIPAAPISCRVVRWLNNEEVIVQPEQ